MTSERVLCPKPQPKAANKALPLKTLPALQPSEVARRSDEPSDSTTLAPAGLLDNLGTGQPLDADTRSFMEPRFGRDFEAVRVHDGPAANAATRSVHALAFTSGRDIAFRSGAYAPGSFDGRKLLAHELAHTLQQASVQRTTHHTLQRQPAATPCQLLHPEDCPTYGQWIATFGPLPTFSARDTPGATPTRFDVLGEGPGTHRTTGDDHEPPAVSPREADHFIDHPTDAWVSRTLPAELRTTAYLLPADCADIAVVLRHVWVFYQGRTELYPDGQGGTWVVGVQTRETDAQRQRRIQDLLVNRVYSGNVQLILNPYADAHGRGLRSFAALEPLLHVGDILVWEHHRGNVQSGARTGGHTQTIESIQRDAATGSIVRLTLLQGNQPISREQADEIRASGSRASEAELRSAAGRRIERAVITSPGGTADENGIWTERGTNETTTLVAAGPARSAARPAAGRGGRSPRDWLPRLRSASRNELWGVFEAALLEARATIEAGASVSHADAADLATAAGERLWALAKAAQDFGNTSHYEPLQRIRASIRALGGISPAPTQPNPHASDVRALFVEIDAQFELAARGASQIAFQRDTRRSTTVLRVLVTGFDPYDPAGSSRPPAADRGNPSGAAALALDGSTVDVGSGVVVAVEAVVLPVSFAQFSGAGTSEGIVERIIRPHATAVDAVITISEDPNLGPGRARIEQFSIGSREQSTLSPHRLLPTETVASPGLVPIPAAPGGSLGPAIIESNAPVQQIAADAADPAHHIAAPDVGITVMLDFSTQTQATRATTLLGLSPPRALGNGQWRCAVSSATAVRRIIAGAQSRTPGHEERLRFRLRDVTNPRAVDEDFEATLAEGPGGAFLSNEVAYRTQRLLSLQGARAPLSFHVHTQGAPETSAAAQEQMRASTLQTLQRIVRAVGLELARRRAATQPATQPQPAATPP